ncbi:MAG TPA: hypothetical protein VHR97_08800, partial [Candidatus Baltobacteraceae bacterium]|nr:hypothetical protein [Candidatus Baltobacteraceae bacterium]
ATFDDKETRIDERVNAAMTMVTKRGPIAAEAERLIERAGQDRLALHAQRQAVAQKLAQVPVTKAEEMTWQKLGAYAEAFPLKPGETLSGKWDAHENERGELVISGTFETSVRDALAPWVKAIGPPILERRERARWRPEVQLHWPLVDSVAKKLRRLSPVQYGPEVYDASDTIVATVLRPGKAPIHLKRRTTKNPL